MAERPRQEPVPADSREEGQRTPRGWVVAEADEQRRFAEVLTPNDTIIAAVERGPALVVLACTDADLGALLYLIRRYRPAVTDAL